MTTRPAVLLVSAGLIHQLDRYAYAKRLSLRLDFAQVIDQVGPEVS